MTAPKLIILGPQGSGKGTQADLLARRFHIPHISTGEQLRQEIAAGTKLGQKISRTMKAGQMVNDPDTNAVMRRRMAQPDCRRGWVVDGYPRRINQARTTVKFLKPDFIIDLQLSDRAAIQRLAGRRVCPQGHIYHLKYDRPKKRAGYCDHDGLKLRQRADDTPAGIRRRLRWHQQETEPVIAWFNRRSRVMTIDARPAIAEVYQKILKELKAWPSSPKRQTSRS